jgi:hypothetical protein
MPLGSAVHCTPAVKCCNLWAVCTAWGEALTLQHLRSAIGNVLASFFIALPVVEHS